MTECKCRPLQCESHSAVCKCHTLVTLSRLILRHLFYRRSRLRWREGRHSPDRPLMLPARQAPFEHRPLAVSELSPTYHLLRPQSYHFPSSAILVRSGFGEARHKQ